AALELVALLAGEHLHADDAAALPSFHAERGVLHVLGLVAEDRTEEALLRRELGLALRRHLAHEDVARADFRADADHALLVEVLEAELADVRDVVGRDLSAELRVAHGALEVLDVDG